MNTTLYDQKDSNIRKTWLIFTTFLVVVIAIGWVFSRAYGSPGILVVAVVLSSFMAIISYWYSDKIVLAMARAVPVDLKSNPELYRIVENLSITAGLPMPRVYLVPEPAPNAFATGRDPEHAVIAVTEGLLRRLDRSELEGVLAHEMSHIGNRDMLVSTVVVILVGFISLLADFFMRSMWFGGMRRRSGNEGGGVFVLVGVVLSILAPIAAMLMQLAISRKREFLADASGALLTRYPEGLANALIKIANDSAQMKVANNTTAHLWFENPMKGEKRTSFLAKLFMTHPPVEDRIKALRGMRV